MKFTAVIVFDATSSAGLLSLNDPFLLATGPARTTSVLENYACILCMSRG